MERSYDLALFRKVEDEYPEWFEGFDDEEWISNPLNVMLVKDGSVGQAEFNYPGVYTMHYYFDNLHGKAARDLAREMIHEMFSNYEARILRGITPVENRPALLMARMVGCQPIGFVTRGDEKFEVFFITEDLLNKKEGKENG